MAADRASRAAQAPGDGVERGGAASSLAGLAAALLPVLRARDVPGFRRVLAEAEELLGDTSELMAWSDASLHTLMADMLREPRRFGLPRWPAASEPDAYSSTPPRIPPRVRERAERSPAPGRAAAASAGAAGAPTSMGLTTAPPQGDEPGRAVTLPLPGFAVPLGPPTALPRRRAARRRPPGGAQQLSLW